MDLNEYLHSVIPKPCDSRPFVCDGRPESCNVIVIGENPATIMNTDWWTFWNDETGFNFVKFQEKYEEARGKKRITNTRLRLNRLRQAGLLCLETNVFVNEGLGGHGSTAPSVDLLPTFIDKLPQLRGVIAHGSVAGKYLANITLRVGVQRHVMRHFRSVSYSELDRVARAILS